MSDDFKAIIDAAAEQAKAKADAAAQGDLDRILSQATELESIFGELKLTDKALYDELTAAVNDATAKNESLASVVSRLKAFGESGAKLASNIGNITSGGALAALRAALKAGSRA